MRNNNFDFLRFLFAFIVVFGHLIEFAGVKELRVFAPLFNTYLSITGFFIISGFLITLSYLKTNNVRKYFIKRSSRLLPAYIFVIVASALFFVNISSLDFDKYFTNIQLYKYLTANLIFLNFLQPCLPGVFTSDHFDCSINGALWTLKVEVGFYLFLPLLIFFLNKVKKKYIFLIAIYILSIVYKQYFVHLSILRNNDFYSMLSRQLPGSLMYFISGMFLFYYFDFLNNHKLLLLLLGLIVMITENYLQAEFFTPIAFSFVIFAIAFGFSSLNNFGKFGDVSYGIYIFHCPIIKTFSHYGGFKNHNPYLATIFILIIVILVGFISWHLLEKRWLERNRL